MARDRSKISTGPNDRSINENIAGTAPGIPDDALAPGEELPKPPTDEEVRRAARKLGAPTGEPSARWNRKTLAAGAAMGIGSAAIVAALLYATRPKRPRR